MAAKPPPAVKTHEFWGTQPVPQEGAELKEEGPIESKVLADVRQDPYPLATPLEWCSPNIEDPAQLTEVYELLRDNYVEDDDSLFRFNYSKEFLAWAMTPPWYFRDWMVGVRRKADSKLLGFISGVPCNIKMGNISQRICEINFLCVHKVLRNKRLAPILIKEVTRRVNKQNIWQAVYTAGVELPKPFATCQYFHRSLNPQKLVEINFSKIGHQFERFSKPLDAMKRNYALPARQLPRLRPMTREDTEGVTKLLQAHWQTYRVAPAFDVEEAGHWLLPRERVVYSFVIADAVTQEITDFVSFYALSSTVIGNTKHSELNAAYGYYYAATKVPLTALITEALIIAKEKGFDVFNVLTLMQNQAFLKELKFGQGDGFLRFYFYNWNFSALKPEELGLVML